LFFRIRGFCFEAVWGNSCGWPKYWVHVALHVLATAALTFAMDRLYAIYLRFIEPGQPVRVALRGPAPRHAP
ncbi:MAG: hypothetical protein ACJ79O_15205, partial [Myxococcales bacterium]